MPKIKYTIKEKAYLTAQKSLMTAAKKADLAQNNYSLAIEKLRQVEGKLTPKSLEKVQQSFKG